MAKITSNKINEPNTQLDIRPHLGFLSGAGGLTFGE